MSTTEFINGDCLSVMNKMIAEGKKVDMIITSPPYNMNLRIRNGKYCSRQIVKEISTKYEGFDDNIPIDEYFEFHKEVLSKMIQISDITFYNFQLLTGNKRAFYKLMGEFADNIKEMIIWDGNCN